SPGCRKASRVGNLRRRRGPIIRAGPHYPDRPRARCKIQSMAVRPPAEEAAPLEVARRIVEVAGDRQAEDIVLLDIGQQASFGDYFVICNGTSERQVKAIVDNVIEELAREGEHALHVEGSPSSGWVLIDFGAVI